jgi:hypothetical protein
MTINLRFALTIFFATALTMTFAPSTAVAWWGTDKDKTESVTKEKGRSDKAQKKSGHHKAIKAKKTQPAYVAPNHFPESDRDAVRAYLASRHGKGCPPGLAKKNNSCLPPGLAKKYAVGDVLPGDVQWNALPANLLGRILPPPAGHFYAQVDQDVLLVQQATNKITDVVTLLSSLQ